jgi:hypothetical protein
MKANNQTPPARTGCERAPVAERDRHVTVSGGRPSLNAIRARHPEYFEDEAEPQSFQRRAIRLQR